MEPYLALFETDLKAGGYVVTFPDFGPMAQPKAKPMRKPWRWRKIFWC